MEYCEKSKLSGYFVTGTDTGVGKTWVTTLLMRQLRESGSRVAGFKPLASGAEKVGDNWQQEDVEAMKQCASVDLPHHLINPYCFEPPIAPYIAAKQAGVQMSVSELEAVVRKQLAFEVDAIVVEGAGGFIQPVNDSESLADLAVALQLPVVMVVGIRLGCINHALLTHDSIVSRGLPFAGWYANCIDPDVLCEREQIELLENRLSCPLLGVIGYNERSAVPWDEYASGQSKAIL